MAIKVVPGRGILRRHVMSYVDDWLAGKRLEEAAEGIPELTEDLMQDMQDWIEEAFRAWCLDKQNSEEEKLWS